MRPGAPLWQTIIRPVRLKKMPLAPCEFGRKVESVFVRSTL
jgi:hypothetical protein